MKIALDYGHCLSGADTGAIGNGYKEQDCTREIGKLVKTKIESLGHTVVEVSPDSAKNVTESLNVRVSKCSEDTDLFVSIHLNCGGGTGTEVYTFGAKELLSARQVLNNITYIGFKNRGIKDGSNFYVIRATPCDSMLIELCFIDNYYDMLKYSENRENLAEAISSGIGNVTFVIKNSDYSADVFSNWKPRWNRNSTGWWYCTDVVNKYYYKDEWKFIDGEWYSFDNRGYARESTWLQESRKWYYLKASCKMAKSEWLWIDGECYYFYSNGAMASNTITPDGYRVNESGEWIH